MSSAMYWSCQDKFGDYRLQHTPEHVTARYDIASKGSLGVLEKRLSNLVGAQAAYKTCRDVFADLYWPGLKRVQTTGEEDPGERAADAILETLDKQVEWQDLRDRCALDGWAVVAAWPAVEKALAECMLRAIEDQQHSGESDSGDDVEDALMKDAESIAMSMEDAEEDAAKAQELRSHLGGVDGPQFDVSVVRMLKRYKRPVIQSILSKMGSLMRSFDAEASRARVSGTQQPIGVALGGNIRSLLPVELGRLGMGGMVEDETMARIVRKQAYEFDKVSTDRAKGGRFTILLDRSGSMKGQPWEDAVSFAGACLLTAYRQGRSVRLFTFNQTSSECHIDVSTPQGICDGIIDLYEQGVRGGTEILMSMNRTGDYGDVLILTDGCDSDPSTKCSDSYKAAGYEGIYVVDLMHPSIASQQKYMHDRRGLMEAADSWITADSVENKGVAEVVGRATVGI